MACAHEHFTSLVWAGLVATILVWIARAARSAKRATQDRLEARKARLPVLDDAPRIGSRYDLCLSDGRVFSGVELLGTTDPDPAAAALGDWGTLLVITMTDGKKAFLRPHAIRVIREA
jgi:hypothetical protein